MPKSSRLDTTLSQSIEASGGLKQFRTVAERPVVRDGPFGPPASSKMADATERPIALNEFPQSTAPKSKIPPPRSTPSERQVEAPAREALHPGFPDKVTVPLTSSLRAKSEALARTLNRRRTIREQRLTSNSIIRVALELFLDEELLYSEQPINSEAELLEFARTKRRR